MNLNRYIFHIVLGFNYFVLYYIIAVNLIYTILLILSMGSMYTYRKKIKYWSSRDMIESSYTPPVSIVIPCFNEEHTVIDNIKSILALEYREFEVVIVNDGSNDKTLDILKKSFKLKKGDMPYREQIKTKNVESIYISSIMENLIVVDKAHGGKADALNAGINICKFPLFTAIDADSIIERKSLSKVVRPFIEDPDVVVSGGIVRPVNDSIVSKGFIDEVKLPKSSLARFQVIEYLRAFFFGRMGWSTINSLLIVSGAFGVFDKKAILEAGGYTKDTIGEDIELIVKIHCIMKEKKKRYKIVFVPDPVCWTQVPEDIKTLKTQRMRWQKGLIDTLVNHRKAILNFKYGTVGLIGMPYYLFVEMIGPVVEIAGYFFVAFSFWYGIIDIEFAIIFFGFSVIYGVFLSVGAVLLEEYNFKKYDKVSEYLLLILYSILENFGYRQLTTIWRFRALWKYRRENNDWGKMSRKKFD